MRRILYTVFTVFGLLVFSSCGNRSTATKAQVECFEQIKQALDSTVHYRHQLDIKLQDYKRKVADASNVEAIYYYNKMIAGCYYAFDSDSARMYIDENMRLAEETHRTEWVVDCLMQRSFLANYQGLLEEVSSNLKQLSVMPKSPVQLQNYYLESISYWSNRAIYYNLTNPDPMAQTYADSLLALSETIPEPMRLHARYWHETDEGKKHELLQEMLELLSTLPEDSEWYPRLYQQAGWLANLEGNTELTLQCFTKELLVDIAQAKRASLAMLAPVSSMAMSCGELDYAKRFITALIAIQQDYPDRIRQVSSPLYPYIMQLNDAIQAREQEASRRVIWLTGFLGVLLIGALFLLYMNARLLRKKTALQASLQEKMLQLDEKSSKLEEEHHKLLEANHQLVATGEQLREEQAHLEEANFLKEEYIGQMFATNSEYLQKIAALKKDINRKLMAKQYEQAIQMTSSKNEKDAEEQHELWNKFDDIFLQLFPDFVEQFNGLLRPEEQIVLRAGERLTSDLRIYALVRLGINSSVKIGKILGLSTQTVYNARQRIRARATESDIDFPNRVKSLKNKPI